MVIIPPSLQPPTPQTIQRPMTVAQTKAARQPQPSTSQSTSPKQLSPAIKKRVDNLLAKFERQEIRGRSDIPPDLLQYIDLPADYFKQLDTFEKQQVQQRKASEADALEAQAQELAFRYKSTGELTQLRDNPKLARRVSQLIKSQSRAEQSEIFAGKRKAAKELGVPMEKITVKTETRTTQIEPGRKKTETFRVFSTTRPPEIDVVEKMSREDFKKFVEPTPNAFSPYMTPKKGTPKVQKIFTAAIDVGGNMMQDARFTLSDGNIVGKELLGKPKPQSERFKTLGRTGKTDRQIVLEVVGDSRVQTEDPSYFTSMARGGAKLLTGSGQLFGTGKFTGSPSAIPVAITPYDPSKIFTGSPTSTVKMEDVKQDVLFGVSNYQQELEQQKAERLGIDKKVEAKYTAVYQRAFDKSEYSKRYNEGSLDFESATKLFNESQRAKEIEKVYQKEYKKELKDAGVKKEDYASGSIGFGKALVDFYTPTSLGEAIVVQKTSQAFKYKPIRYAAYSVGSVGGTSVMLNTKLDPATRVTGGIVAGVSMVALGTTASRDVYSYLNKPRVALVKDRISVGQDKINQGRQVSKPTTKYQVGEGGVKQFDVRQQRMVSKPGRHTEITTKWRGLTGQKPKFSGSDVRVTTKYSGLRSSVTSTTSSRKETLNYLMKWGMSEKGATQLLQRTNPKVTKVSVEGTAKVFTGKDKVIAFKGQAVLEPQRVKFGDGLTTRGGQTEVVRVNAIYNQVGTVNNKPVYYYQKGVETVKGTKFFGGFTGVSKQTTGKLQISSKANLFGSSKYTGTLKNSIDVNFADTISTQRGISPSSPARLSKSQTITLLNQVEAQKFVPMQRQLADEKLITFGRNLKFDKGYMGGKKIIIKSGSGSPKPIKFTKTKTTPWTFTDDAKDISLVSGSSTRPLMKPVSTGQYAQSVDVTFAPQQTVTTLQTPKPIFKTKDSTSIMLLGFSATQQGTSLSRLEITETAPKSIVDTKSDDVQEETEAFLSAKISGTKSGSKSSTIQQPVVTPAPPAQITTYVPTTPTINPRPPQQPGTPGKPIIGGIPFFFPGEKGFTEKNVGYDIHVRTKKKYQKINTRPHSFKSARDRGARIIDNTTASQFKVTPRKTKLNKPKTFKRNQLQQGDGYFNQTRNKYRDFRVSGTKKTKMRNSWIEKEKYRIDTPGESRGLGVANFLKKRQSRGFRL